MVKLRILSPAGERQVSHTRPCASVADPSAQSHRAACRPRFSSIRKNSPGGPDSAAAGTPRGRQAWCRLLGAPAGPARDIGAQHVVGCRDPVIPDRLAAWANSRTTAVSPPISTIGRATPSFICTSARPLALLSKRGKVRLQFLLNLFEAFRICSQSLKDLRDCGFKSIQILSYCVKRRG